MERRAAHPLAGADQGAAPEQVRQRAGPGQPGADVEAEQRRQHRGGAERGDHRHQQDRRREVGEQGREHRGQHRHGQQRGERRAARHQALDQVAEEAGRHRRDRDAQGQHQQGERRVRGPGDVARPDQPAYAGPPDEHQGRGRRHPRRGDVPAGQHGEADEHQRDHDDGDHGQRRAGDVPVLGLLHGELAAEQRAADRRTPRRARPAARVPSGPRSRGSPGRGTGVRAGW